MPIEPWRVLDVTTWEDVAEEQRGKREKRWVMDPQQQLWLRKVPHPERPFEHAIEALVLRLARASGLPAAEGHVCTWAEAGHSGHRAGIAVRSFTMGAQELVQGNTLLGSLDAAYDPERHEAHTLERVRRVLAAHDGPAGELTDAFVDMLLFDAWVGNGDRHQENWGLLLELGVPLTLAPMYDVAACLGAELNDQKLE